MPAGDHPLEVAARRGIGPLSGKGREIWHGHAAPCVSCGLLVLRDQRECNHCGQDLSDEMLDKMRAHAGPWHVHEHLHPFPGVSLERIIRQIRRKLLTETSIVRGPATDFQWRFAVETPGLCRYFGRCWKCYKRVSGSDSYCPACLSYLSFDKPQPIEPASLEPVESSEPAGPALAPPRQLEELTAVLDEREVPQRDAIWDDPPRIGRIRATWIAGLVLVIAVISLVWVTRLRSADMDRSTKPDAAIVAPGNHPP
ncbi:MAG: hypothetical protein IIB60_00975 [Planctomycetes bacterium]|nr:hypothetical protein [Planctomycetota bacterium]